jgi:Zn-dependent M28 family amino/carboxypeptidase
MLTFIFNPPLWRFLVSVCRFLNLFAGLCGALATAAVCAEGASVSPAMEQAAKTYITRNSLEASIRLLSSDALEGRGPEVVIYSAHHDHFGIGEPDSTGDRIYHGAVDNASGCSQVLAMARAFAALPERPRRSVLMLFVGGEERNLLGSTHYALHPTFAPGKIAANVNYDGGKAALAEVAK